MAVAQVPIQKTNLKNSALRSATTQTASENLASNSTAENDTNLTAATQTTTNVPSIIINNGKNNYNDDTLIGVTHRINLQISISHHNSDDEDTTSHYVYDKPAVDYYTNIFTKISTERIYNN